jgi:hypothetical protein
MQGAVHVSFVNDISGALVRRSVQGGQPTTSGANTAPAPSAASQLQARFGSVFQSTFSSSMATVFARGANGEFDDPTIALQEAAATQRLRAAQELASAGGSGATTTTGASAAPTATGSDAAQAATMDVSAAAQREVYALREKQSEARLSNISSSLAREFPKGAELTSASTGTWDPATFKPRTRAEVEAFAQRMVIDATEAAARLDIVTNQLDAAKFDAAHGGGAAATTKVAQLQAAYDRQRTYVDKLAKIVDDQSGGEVSDAGQDAIDGNTMRDGGDKPVDEIVATLRRSGMDNEQVARVVGAQELSVEEDRTPGGSPRLRKIADDMTATLLKQFNKLHEKLEDARQQDEEERELQRARDDAHAQAHRADETRMDQAQRQRSAQRQADFQHWMETLADAQAQQRRGRQAG